MSLNSVNPNREPTLPRDESAPAGREPMLPENAAGLGVLDKIQIGMTREDVVAALGPADDQGGTSRKHRSPRIYRYGNIQLFFHSGNTGRLHMVWREDADGEGTVLME